MKKLLLGAALGISAISFAQVDFSQTRFGIIAGGNYSRVRNAHNPSGPRYTFQVGGLALIPVDNNDQFFIQPEVVYYGAGETGKNKNAKGKPGYNALYANNYISVPLYFKAYFSEAESEFFGLIGPRFNFLMSQNIKDYPTTRPWYTEEGSEVSGVGNVNGKAASFNFAVGAGVGYSYKRQLELGLRYDIGLSNTYKSLMNEPVASADVKKKKSEQVLSLSLSYIFQ